MLTGNSRSGDGAGQLQSGPSGPSARPPLSNTGVSSSHPLNGRTPKRLTPSHISVGCDWLSHSAYGGFPRPVWDELRPRLEHAREQAKPDKPFELQTADGDTVGVMANQPLRGLPIKWCLQWQGSLIGLVDAIGSRDGHPTAFCSHPSLPLMVHGHENRYHGALGVLKGLGFDLSHTGRPSRFDIAVDLAGVFPDDLVALARLENRVVCRVPEHNRVYRQVGRRYPQLDYGKRGSHAITIQVYDKWKEVADNIEKLPIMRERWGGEVPNCATRIEWRVGGKSALMERFEVRCVEDVFDRLPEICEYLTEEWFRFTDRSVDPMDKHQWRAKPSPLMRQVIGKMKEWAGEPERVYLAKPKPLPDDVEGLHNQRIGCGISAYLRTQPDGDQGTDEDVLERYLAYNVQHDRKHAAEVVRKLRERAQQFRIQSAGGLPVDSSDIPF